MPHRVINLEALPGLGESVRHLVTNVVILTSSSRSGSSLLYEQIRWGGFAITPNGEPVPLVRQSVARDAAPLEHELDHLMTLLAVDSGIFEVDGAGVTWEDFANTLVHRLAWQWPDLAWNRDLLCDALETTGYSVHRITVDLRTQGRRAEAQGVILAAIRRAGPQVNAVNYDIGIPLSDHDPRGCTLRPGLVEDTPYVLPTPQRPPTSFDWGHRTLVIKGPAEARRMHLWQRCFPNAEIRVLHLTRRPEAAVNGLIDGWRSSHFHSFYEEGSLSIPGYTVDAETASWWKFDRLPDWEEYASRRLAEVAAAQWRTANEAILRSVARAGVATDRSSYAYKRVSFEDLLGARGPEVRREVLDWIARGSIGEPHLTEAAAPPIMSTVAPAPDRWRARMAHIFPALMVERCLPLAEELGYAMRDPQLMLGAR